MEQNRVGIIILAAGASVRLGTPKQLLLFEGSSLLRRIAGEALASGCRPVIVVLGADYDKFRGELGGLDALPVENPDWKEGMASSIRAGLRKLLEVDPAVEAAVLAVCDQPFVTAAAFERILETFRRTGAPVVASAYRDTLGVPALFGKNIFSRLAGLQGSRGAKPIIREFQDSAVGVPIPEASIDIDTPEDLEILSQNCPAPRRDL